MHETRPAKITSPIVSLNEGYVRTIPVGLIVGAIGVGAAYAISTASNGLGGGLARFLHIYLTCFCFLLSITLGCLFFVTIMHLTRAGWSATVRRIAELYAMCIAPMFILALPIVVLVLFGDNSLYIWNQPGWSIHGGGDGVTVDNLPPLEQLKIAFLNDWFFAIRVVAYFAIWTFMAWFFL